MKFSAITRQPGESFKDHVNNISNPAFKTEDIATIDRDVLQVIILQSDSSSNVLGFL